jgi:hypothetical protein
VLDILDNSGCRLKNAATSIVTLSPDFEEESCIHNLNAIEFQIK